MSLQPLSPLSPEALKQALSWDEPTRAAWCVEEIARQEMAWTLRRQGEALPFQLQDKILAQGLWPRQELAALEAQSDDEPYPISLDELLEARLPDWQSRGWKVALFPSQGKALVQDPLALADALSQAWEEED